MVYANDDVPSEKTALDERMCEAVEKANPAVEIKRRRAVVAQYSYHCVLEVELLNEVGRC